jgi:hypothetical protein
MLPYDQRPVAQRELLIRTIPKRRTRELHCSNTNIASLNKAKARPA